MEQIRSFIAIELSDELKQKLGQLEASLKAAGIYGVRWVDPESIHLTLKFLGDIATDRTGEITSVMEESFRGTPPFRLIAEGLGVFPNLRRVQVAWVGLGGDTGILKNLQQKLESDLERLGFPAEKRAFTPHLTLARVNNRASSDDRQRLGKLISETDFNPVTMEVNSVNLMQSQLTRQGALYSKISMVDLS